MNMSVSSISSSYKGLLEWSEINERFLKCHNRACNVLLHLIATPLGVFGILSLVTLVSPFIAIGCSCFYLGTLFLRVPFHLWAMTTLLIGLILAAALSFPLSLALSIAAIAIGYFLQEMSHQLSREPSLQSSYMSERAWPAKLALQTYYLIPLIFSAFFRIQGAIFGFLSPPIMVLNTKLTTQSSINDLAILTDYISQLNPSREHTFHRWQQELEPEIQSAFTRIANSEHIMEMFRNRHGRDCIITVLPDMNELYVTGPMKKLSSDSVFKTPHIDGPWAIFPFAAVYRSMAAASENRRVTTHFPLNGESYAQPLSFTIDTGEVVAFDYNREPHYITVNEELPEANRRINLKLHYLVYPRWLHPIGKILGYLSVRYNERARQLFLDTLKPNSLMARIYAWIILISTHAFEKTERFIGFSNLVYTLVCAITSMAFGSLIPFLAGMSFVHYFMYIGTFAKREQVSFVKFKRNVIYFKSIAYTLLIYLMYEHQPSIQASILIISGFTIAALASYRLGVNRSYFAAELGWAKYERNEQFPYGTIPHPMILGSIIGLIGVYAIDSLRLAYPWLIPTHITLYLFHLIQECRDPNYSEVQDSHKEDVQSAHV